MRSGEPLTQLVEFPSGLPDGDVSWKLLGSLGATITLGAITPAADAASIIINVGGVSNTLADGVLFDHRELQWSYTVGGTRIAGRLRYRIDAFLPFGVSEEGVRRKLGLEAHELEDGDIDLVAAYVRFLETVTQDALDAATSFTALKACDAIEAMAALAQLPTLQLKVAQKESSGTDQYQRAKVDWETIRGQLDQYVADGIAAVNPSIDPTAEFGPILVVVTRDDPVTGAAA